MNIFSYYKKIPLLNKLLVSMLIGVILGIVFKEKILIIKPLGTIFLNILKMAALPLVIVNLISGISSLDDPKIFGRVGLKIMIYYFFTTFIAIIIGLISGYIFKPGIGFTFKEKYETAIQTIPSFGETIVGLLPSNIFEALTNARFDQIVVFSAIVGIAILFLEKDDKKTLTTLFNSLAKLFNKIIAGIMLYAPIGICALIASTIGTYGSNLLGFIAKYLGASYSAIILHLLVYLILLMIFAKVNPITFFKQASVLIITALGTSSSLACIPVSMSCADELKCSRSISSFTIPLGSQVNKDGNGMMLAITFLFAAQAINSPLSLVILIKVIIISLILTTGAGGVPGGGIVTIAIVIDAFNLPLEVVGIVSGIFALIDMGYTMMNCLGDLVGTIIVSRSEDKYIKQME